MHPMNLPEAGAFFQPQEGFENEAADKMGRPAFRRFVFFD